MPARRLTLPAVATLVLACLVLGVLAALADGESPARPAPVERAPLARAVAALPSVRAAVPVPATYPVPVPVPVPGADASGAPAIRVPAPGAAAVPFVLAGAPCGPGSARTKPPVVQPVPQGLLDAFGVLRRPRADADALPAEALAALRTRGLEPFDPGAARLLRTTADGGRAWVVPVRDARTPPLLVRCSLRPGATRPRVLVLPTTPRARRAPRPRKAHRTPTTPRTVPAPTPVPAAPVPAPVPAAPVAPQTAKAEPRPGLAVVAVDGAPAGAGGTLEDLVRGREPVATGSCAGPNKDMTSISGVVPDGVAAAFLTSPDGTAVRADVKDNAYTFTIPPTRAPAQRYVVWTGGDGTPHVQPVATRPFTIPAARCKAFRRVPTISPDPFAAWPVVPPGAPATLPRPPRRHG